jgi:glycosyltransferase involved in cell wall biosynthesis
MSGSLMRVALDTNPLYASRAGVARYVQGLRQGLRDLAPGELELQELGWAVENFGFAQPARALKTAWRELVWAPWVAPGRMREVDLVHHTFGPLLPFVRGPRHVMTLCDLALLRHPERYRAWHLRAGLRRLQRVKAADRVICISRFTADEAIALLGLPAAKLEVVQLAPTLAAQEETVPGLPDEFYLFVGSLEPGKNLAFLNALWREAGPALPPLVIVGARWTGVAGEGAPPANWIYLGHQSDAALRGLYRRAQALLFPSLYEGFGLPPLEAMAAGCPVICAPRASLPEVVGEAAAVVELETGRWRQALAAVGREPEAWRERGRRRAAGFSWEKCARETVAVYRDVLGA